MIGKDVIDAYVTETARLVPSMYSRDLKIVYDDTRCGYSRPSCGASSAQPASKNVTEVVAVFARSGFPHGAVPES